ncbi:hypothetical protein NPIL_568611 [Nephila pilipes]|uniref:Uncharacterized protein n=1 Tax=Nephila pilipes TaxID=299642 RepID=A0A8X6MQN5_NEPPI|nr:hypothetical protein NPIL_568611 [Nephila pilipes]
MMVTSSRSRTNLLHFFTPTAPSKRERDRHCAEEIGREQSFGASSSNSLILVSNVTQWRISWEGRRAFHALEKNCTPAFLDESYHCALWDLTQLYQILFAVRFQQNTILAVLTSLEKID